MTMRQKAKAATAKKKTAQKNTKTHLTAGEKSLVETAEVFFRGPSEAVKLQPRHTTLAILLL